MASDASSVRAKLLGINQELLSSFKAKKRVVSFAEYLELVKATPKVHLRSSSQFLKGCFDYFGTDDVKYPWGKVRRFRLFDCPWTEERDPLLGQEAVQNQVYRALSNFVNEGAANKLILLHGPNGSAKSTFVRCVGRAMQVYSQKDEGALYRFNWILPRQRPGSSGIGFGGGASPESATDSYAHLPDNLIDAKLSDELRDHPLLLLPVEIRKELMEEWLAQDAGEGADEQDRFVISDYLLHGKLSHRNRSIYEALLANYQGDFLQVLRHVQVERFFVSQRYREACATVEPQLSVDAHERQITQDNSVAALPPALQSLTLFRYGGELVMGNRGIVEYSDLLKRPLEAFKYLLTTVELGSVSLSNATLHLDLCFVGTSNEIHLHAFKEIAEFQSFRGRLELVRVPYLLDLHQEEEIYRGKLHEAARSKHVAPHSAYVAALWSVATRMKAPNLALFPEPLRPLLGRLTALEKVELYASGKAPSGVGATLAKELVACVGKLREEGAQRTVFEGLTGASPRELQSVLFNAGNSQKYEYMSPLGILEEIEELCKHTSVYEFLRQEAQPQGYQDHRGLIAEVRERYTDRVDNEFRSAMGLVDDEEYRRVFSRYILHVTHFNKDEKVRNEATGGFAPADERMMGQVESTLGRDGDAKEFRQSLISKIGAWALDNPGKTPDYESIFSDHFQTLRDAYFAEHIKVVKKMIHEVSVLLRDEEEGKTASADQAEAKAIIDRLCGEFGYNRESARDTIRHLYRARYAD